MLSFHIKSMKTDGQMDRQTSAKQYGHPPTPDLLIRGHKNEQFEIVWNHMFKFLFTIPSLF